MTDLQQAHNATVTIVEADSLVAADKSGTSDPFVVVGYVYAATGDFHQLWKTKTIQKTLTPKWQTTKSSFLPPNSDLSFRVFDANTLSKSVPIGFCRLPVPSFQEQQEIKVDKWLLLEGVACGRLHVEVKFAVTNVKQRKRDKLLHAVEKQLRIDLNGDGAIGEIQDIDELARLRLENRRLKDILLRLQQERQQVSTSASNVNNNEDETTVVLDERLLDLARKAEETRIRLRRIQSEVVDTPKEVFARTVHNSPSLTLTELTLKEMLWKRVTSTVGAGKALIKWENHPKSRFGIEMREKHFFVEDCFLNSASYGCCPKAVIEAGQAWRMVINTDPVTFLIKSRQMRLNEIAFRVCGFLGCDSNDFVWMANANTATSTVFKSFRWEVGDRLLLFSCDYEATRLAADWLEENHGVEIVDVSIVLPMTDDEILTEVEKTLIHLSANPPMPRLANFCHITSRTAWLFPAKRLVQLFHRYNVPVCIDGAQVPGHIPLNISDIGADYYIGTLHKWMYTIQGTAFLVVSPLVKAGLTPLTVSYNYPGGYEREFSYAGLLDFSGFLAVGEALDWVERVCGGWSSIWEHCNAFARDSVAILEKAWGTKVFQGDQSHYCRMPIIPFPAGDTVTSTTVKALMVYLATKEHITAFLPYIQIGGKKTLCVRVSAQVFNTIEDVNKLAQAVLKMKGNYSTAALAVDIAREFLF